MSQKIGKNKRGGFTLTELIIVLAIIGLVTSTIWAVGGNTRHQQQISDAIEQLQTVALNVLTLKMAQGKNFTGTFPADITSNMIAAQAIPRAYVSIVNPAMADTPWMRQNFLVTQIAAKKFRISFNFPTLPICMGLVLAGTACEAGEKECPEAVLTRDASATYTWSPTSSVNWSSYTASLGWKNMTVNQASTACSANTAATSSIAFDYVF